MTATEVQEALVVDTVFPFCYTIFLAGSLLLLASWPFLARWSRRSAAWFAWAAIFGGSLDLIPENGSLILVTLEGWPPTPTTATRVYLLVAGVAAWLKAGLLGLSLLAIVGLIVAAGCRAAISFMRGRSV